MTMSPAKSGRRYFLRMGALGIVAMYISHPSIAQNEQPDYVRLPLRQVGRGIYRRYGFRVYEAVLWAPSAAWDPEKPFLLELHYVRSISKETLVESVIDDIREQNASDEVGLTKWAGLLSKILPAVDDGDTLSGFSEPGIPTKLFINSKEIATIDDDSLSVAFFNMWFGDHADPELRRDLLGRPYPSASRPSSR